MDPFPPQPSLKSPPIFSGVTLAGLQIIACGGVSLIAFLVDSIFDINLGSAAVIVGTFVGGFTYGAWSEIRVPNSLARTGLVATLALYATVVEALISGGYLLVVFSTLPRGANIPDGPGPKFFAVVMPVAYLACFFVTWSGLYRGQRFALRRRVQVARSGRNG